MRTPVRLGLYGLVLAAVFAVSAVTAGAVVPKESVQGWARQTAATDQHAAGAMDTPGRQGPAVDASALGLSVAKDGYQLTGLTATPTTGRDGKLSLTITGPDGQPVTEFERAHDKDLHLIVVRADGQHFRHVHPVMAADGTWSIPWTWDAAGTYRVFADFVPARTGAATTLSASLNVAGDYEPISPEPVATTTVDGYQVSVAGALTAGESTELTMTVARGGEPVTTLEPYLGAFGHLVALRQSDLAYLHVHPHGAQPQAGQTSGPTIVFEANAPTPGRYLLYLDFQIAGRVHTAPLVLDTTTGSGSAADHDSGEHSTTGIPPAEGSGHDHG